MTQTVKSITQEPKHAATIKRWEAFWALEDVGRPLWMIPTSPVLTVTLTGGVPLPKLFQDRDTQLQAQLAVLGWREQLDIDDDFVPHIQAQGGVTVFASAFGCEVEFFEHTLPWAHPVIKADDPPEKVYELEPPDVTSGQLGQMLEFTDYFIAQTQGRYPLALTDLQGPLDTAYLVWEPSAFMLAMYTNPKEVHHLMRMVTDLIIRFVREQRSRCPEYLPCHYPPLWLPDGHGIAISDDGLAVISAKLYEEFCLPYVNELSDEFGGMMIHSCGNFVHQFGNLEKVHNLRGINFGASETPFEAVWERFQGKTAIITHLGLNNNPHFESNREYLQHVLSRKTHNRGLCVLVVPGEMDAKMNEPGSIERFVQRVKETLAEYP
ncbi:MAG: uroporphyrinogen decarboxylase family protein [Dehalococcoidia bacterium]|nr:uroporphyrinogen decarboxylase family protein [Dehalococcoidia bacterium]